MHALAAVSGGGKSEGTEGAVSCGRLSGGSVQAQESSNPKNVIHLRTLPGYANFADEPQRQAGFPREMLYFVYQTGAEISTSLSC